MTANEHLDPVAVSAARERLAQLAQWLEDKLRTYSVTTLTLDGQDLEAMQVCVSALAARDEASEAMRALEEMLKREGLPTLKMRGEWNGCCVHASLGWPDWPNPLWPDWPNPLAEVTSFTTAGAAIQALRQAVQQGDGT